MQTFQIHTVESAPENSRPALEGLQKNFGFVPNTAAIMSDSSVLIGSFVGAFGHFHGSTLSGQEKQVVLLTNAVTLDCEWTTAFHSTLALKEGVAATEVQRIRDGKLPEDARFAALSGLARALIENKGLGVDAEIDSFIAAGHAKRQVLDVIAGIAISTMAGLTANIAQPPVEALFQPQAWRAA
jgi:alkylhydroperoxidase/carboxymuconolactone decarboxylase family protein YurZ